MLQPNQSAAEPSLSIDSIFKALRHWRENKASYPNKAIPDEIWKDIFSLEKSGHQASLLRRLFSLNSQQYRKKYEQFQSLSTKIKTPQKTQSENQTKPTVDISFSEVISKEAAAQSVPTLSQAANQAHKNLKQLRSNDSSPESYLDTSTLIIECLRPDGCRLKIHATSQSLQAVMQAFFE